MVTFNLRLGDTYWSNGFFNVSVDFERYLTKADGPIKIFLGGSAEPLVGRVSRSANKNATPRIYGNKPLADFFQKGFKRGDCVPVEIISLDAVRIGSSGDSSNSVTKPLTASPKVLSRQVVSVSADELAKWRRALIGILNQLEPDTHRGSDEGLAKRIHRLSQAGLIPREVAAMMRVVTEMRNMTEYQSKVLTATESAAVTSAWAAVQHWRDGRVSRG